MWLIRKEIMAEQEYTPEEIARQLAGMIDLLESAQNPALEELASIQEKRLKRLVQVEKRLAPSLDEDDPRLGDLRRSMLHTEGLRRDLSAQGERTGKVPRPKPNEWSVYGQVQDHTGKAVASVRVRLFDKEHKYDDVLGFTTTDKSGEFSFTFHERVLTRAGEKPPELFLRVEDRRGQEIFSTKESIAFGSGKASYVLVELPRGKR
jgi:hypothetical protein